MDHKEGLIVGRNAVLQALESGRTIDSVTVAQGQRGGQAGRIIDICRERKIPVKFADQRRLDRLCDGAAHQGVAAFAAAHEYAEMDDIFALAESRNESPFIVVCDSLEDPHNLGAILRSAEAAGVHGVIIPKRNSVTLNYTVAKTSAGAIEYVPVVKVANLPGRHRRTQIARRLDIRRGHGRHGLHRPRLQRQHRPRHRLRGQGHRAALCAKNAILSPHCRCAAK